MRLVTDFCKCSFSEVNFGTVSSESMSESTEASRRGYGSGASDNEEYNCRKEDDEAFPWFVRRSIKAW